MRKGGNGWFVLVLPTRRHAQGDGPAEDEQKRATWMAGRPTCSADVLCCAMAVRGALWNA